MEKQVNSNRLKQKRFNLFLFFVSILVYTMGFAQQKTITGLVVDKTTKESLPGVSITLKDTSIGTITDFNGNFTLNAEKDQTLIFSFMGFSNLEVVIGDNDFINVQLIESTESLDEVVLIGYGSVQKKDLTGTADLIKSDEFNKGQVLSPQQLISGKIAGVNVTSAGGSPGEGQNIIIRGLGSLSLTSSPLIVVDGVPLNDGGIGGARNPLNLINPNDIDNMVVLKDASATAIYGSRSANGVILITTKKGKDSEFKFNFNTSLSYSIPIDKVDMFSSEQFTTLVNGSEDPNSIALLGSSKTDWQDEIYTNAFGTDNTFSALGSAWGVPLRISAGYTYQDGILETDNFKRTTASINLNPSFLEDHLKIDINARGMFTNNSFANRDAIGSALVFDPTQSVFDENSQYAGYFAWLDPNSGIQANLAPINPVALINLVDDTADVNQFIGNAKFDYKLHFLPEVVATVNFGYDKSKSDGRTITSEFMPTTDLSFDGANTTFEQETTNKLFDAFFTYKKSINDDHNINAVVGYSYQSFEFYSYNYDSELEEDAIENPDLDIKYEFIDKSENVLISYFGRFNYDYKGKYLFTTTLRADASSKLNPDDRWGYFPSFAVAWNVVNEKFMTNSSFNILKLRLGFGKVGNVNGLGDYLFLTRYQGSTSTANYQFGSNFLQTFRPEPVNQDLKWEVGQTFNVGLDYGLLDNRISGSVNVYLKKTKDLIAEAFVDPFTNFGNRIDKNIGDMENRGIEFTLNLIPVQTVDFDWSINYNVSFNENEITRLPFQQQVGAIGGGFGNHIQLHTEGEAPFSYYVYQQVYSNGKPVEGVFVDRNLDGVITEDDRYIYKNPYASVIMGLSTNLRYKNWDLSVVTRANFGNYNYNNVASSLGFYDGVISTTGNFLNNIHSDFLNTGFVNNDETNLASDYFVQEASFFKIDNITLGYRLPEDIFKDIGLRVYGSAQNVGTVSDYTGLDPEIPGGVDGNFYPRPRVFILGLNVDF